MIRKTIWLEKAVLEVPDTYCDFELPPNELKENRNTNLLEEKYMVSEDRQVSIAAVSMDMKEAGELTDEGCLQLSYGLLRRDRVNFELIDALTREIRGKDFFMIRYYYDLEGKEMYGVTAFMMEESIHHSITFNCFSKDKSQYHNGFMKIVNTTEFVEATARENTTA